MAQWGRNDQAVTANSSTTVESSNGAPIGTYALVKGDQVSRVDGANAHFGNTSPGTRANTDVRMFNNVTPSAFLTGQAVGVFGVSVTEHANNKANSNEHGAHAGWNLRRAGTGPIVSGVYTNSGTGFNNNDILVVKSPVAGGNAFFNISTNATGGAVSLTLNNAGFGFTGTGLGNAQIATSNLFITAAGGGAAAGNTNVTYFTVMAGGRAGRVHHETLVAFGSLGAQTAAYGTPALVADATSDNTLFPGT
jgi:hypothetical protein